ncbi:hypothetical protein [Bremerella alba]|uniref:Uncharacterized protein n=1 Tax=Bremerella alba TaxID=980252 RepID=A0A7V8V2E7_9BACT|nr:hypothetical protein [Bremerella alba]MBA2113655.1 hypothetical protein [Bremerella alba]
MAKKKSVAVPAYSSSQLCEAIESQDDVALAAARVSEDPLVNAKLQGLIRDQLGDLYDATKKSATIQNRVSKRMTCLVNALRGKKDASTQSILLELFDNRTKIAKAQGKAPKHDINATVMQSLASSTDVAADALFDKLEEFNLDDFFWAITLGLRFCEKEKVFDTFHNWVAPAPETPKRKHAKAKAESVMELLDLYQSGVLYAHGYALGSVDADDPNHIDHVSPEDRLDGRWLGIAIEVGNIDLIRSLARPGHQPTQDWAEQRLLQVIEDGKKSKIRAIKFVGLLITSDHPQLLDRYEQAIEHFLKKKDAWEVAICLEMIPRLPDSSVPRLEAIELPSELAQMRDQFLTQLKNDT